MTTGMTARCGSAMPSRNSNPHALKSTRTKKRRTAWMRDGEQKRLKPRQTHYEPFLSIQLFCRLGAVALRTTSDQRSRRYSMARANCHQQTGRRRMAFGIWSCDRRWSWRSRQWLVFVGQWQVSARHSHSHAGSLSARLCWLLRSTMLRTSEAERLSSWTPTLNLRFKKDAPRRSMQRLVLRCWIPSCAPIIAKLWRQCSRKAWI